jgi:methanogenic corrinoid protein MtbC1
MFTKFKTWWKNLFKKVVNETEEKVEEISEKVVEETKEVIVEVTDKVVEEIVEASDKVKESAVKTGKKVRTKLNKDKPSVPTIVELSNEIKKGIDIINNKPSV